MERKCKRECFPPGSKSGIFLRMKLLTFFVLVSMVTATADTYSRQIQSAAKLADPVEVTNAAEQQKQSITGVVKDGQGIPLPGVTVVVKGTVIGTITNVSGQFKLTVPADAKTLIFSFIGMSIVVFLSFRTFVPSGAVVLSAFADIVMTAAMMNLVGIQLSLGTLAALLMLIGYSVDSDILLTNRVLKRQGKLNEKLSGAFHTGIIMTTTTLAATTAMFLVSWFGAVQIIYEISAVLLIGLLFDVMNTWLTNVGIIKWYVLKGGGK